MSHSRPTFKNTVAFPSQESFPIPFHVLADELDMAEFQGDVAATYLVLSQR